MTVENLFAKVTEATTNSTRSLAGTAQLTSLSDGVAKIIYEAAKSDPDAITELGQSMVDIAAADRLINKFGELATHDYTFLFTIDEDQLEAMLKSQQSKRSRCKSKTMTVENYLNMMSAAVAEQYIRLATGKDKSSAGRGPHGTSVIFTEERLAVLAADQETLRKEIRNVQSKKSIMKSKADFSEEDERWQNLLVAEVQLKGIRVGTASVSHTEYVDATRETLKEMLAEVDIQAIKLNQAKELLDAIYTVVFEADEDNDEPADDILDTPVE